MASQLVGYSPFTRYHLPILMHGLGKHYGNARQRNLGPDTRVITG